jgi:hypothetical protein
MARFVVRRSVTIGFLLLLRPPVSLAGHPLAGTTGYGRLSAAIFTPIPVRDLRGMQRSRRSTAPTAVTKETDLQVL